MNENLQLQAVPAPTDKVAKNLRRQAVIAVGSAATFALTTGAQAAGEGGVAALPDFAPILALIYGMVALVAGIGMAVLSVYSTGKVFKWVKAAF